MTREPNLVTILGERDVADLREMLEMAMQAAFAAGMDWGNEVWPMIAAIRALCDSHEVLRLERDDLFGKLWYQ